VAAVSAEEADSGGFLMSRRVEVAGKGSSAKALIYLDPGSQVSFITTRLARELGLENGKRATLAYLPFHSKAPKRLATEKHRVALTRADGGKEEMALNVIDFIGTRLSSIAGERGRLAVTEQEPDVLVGLKDFWKVFVGKEEVAPGRYRIRTTLGEVLCGAWPWGQPSQRHIPVYSTHVWEAGAGAGDEQVQEFWDLETLGVKDNPLSTLAADDARAQQLFDETVRCLPSGRLEVGWPWRDAALALPDNFGMAYQRLESVLRKLRQDPVMARAYCKVFDEQRGLGIWEPAQRSRGGREHYLSHHAVVTHKVRIVFDASASSRGRPSLNDCLLRGPTILPSLAGVLLRFRACRYPLLADLEKAFLQLDLREPDREVVKFLWVRDVNAPLTPANLVIGRFSRVVFGVISSPFLLAAALRYLLKKAIGRGGKLAAVAAELLDDTYVDNLLLRCETGDEAVEKAHLARELFDQAGFTLREFTSNAPEVEKLPAEWLLGAETPKVLGIPWQRGAGGDGGQGGDELRLEFPTEPVAKLTRRTVLKALAGVFDPLGWACPALLEAKLNFQALWDGDKTWDSPLTAEEEEKWRQVESGWLQQTIAFPRATLLGGEVELHAFTDASDDAYGCAVYARVSEAGKAPTSHLLFAKSRLRPRNLKITTPRMELMGAVLGVRALATIKRELRLKGVSEFIWCDNKGVLYWIDSTSRPEETFVRNRLEEIRLSSHVHFAYVPTAENPADWCTRKHSARELQNRSETTLWWQGPHWLKQPPEQWPQKLVAKVKPWEEAPAAVAVLAVAPATEPFLNRVNWENKATWHQWVRVFAYLQRYLQRCRARSSSGGRALRVVLP
jgi:hypothetical protein